MRLWIDDDDAPIDYGQWMHRVDAAALLLLLVVILITVALAVGSR